MSTEHANLNSLPPSELLSEIERLLEVVRAQQQQIQVQQEMIERMEGQVAQQGERIKQLEDELRAQKKLKLELSRQNIRFQLAEYVTVSGETVVGQLPKPYPRPSLRPDLRELRLVPTLPMSGTAAVNP